MNVDNAFCRYGPDTAYLYAWGLERGDHVSILNRSQYGAWLWVRPDEAGYNCWVAASLLDVVDGEVESVVIFTDFWLPKSVLYGPIQSVGAVRDGKEVTVNWEAVFMTLDDDRGYFIEVWLCQNGAYFWDAVQTDKLTYTFIDDDSCNFQSSGKIFVVEKHGYTDPVAINWP